MFSKYIKLTLNKKNNLLFLKLNIFPSILEILNLFILPLVVRQYYIIGQYGAITIKLSALFLFEASIIFISSYTLDIHLGKKKHNYGIFSKALFFAFLKTSLFVAFLYMFKKAIKLTPCLAFLFCFFSMLFFLSIFYFPCLLVKNNFITSFGKSIRLYFSYPFFTTFVFLHSIILFFISMVLLGIYPGISKIIYNIHLAINIMEEKKSVSTLENTIITN